MSSCSKYRNTEGRKSVNSIPTANINLINQNNLYANIKISKKGLDIFIQALICLIIVLFVYSILTR